MWKTVIVSDRKAACSVCWLSSFKVEWVDVALATTVPEEGTHEDLLKRGGSYFQLVQCQLSAGEKQTIEAKDVENGHRQ